MKGRTLDRRAILAAVGTILTISLSLAGTAAAGIVYGRVSGGDGKFRPAETVFDVFDLDGRSVARLKSDKNYNYSVGLVPGTYRVEFTVGGQSWSASIRASEGPVRQDILFRPKD